MKSILYAFCVAYLLWAGAPAETAGTPSDTGSQAPAEVAGEINVVQAQGKQSLKDQSQVVAWLTPANGVKFVSATAQNAHYRLVQRNKRFEPALLVVPVGSVVDFPNEDPWFHNVFSLYRGKRFDLGLYQAGSQRSVRFDKPGVSYLFCNIHPEMTGVVLAVESELFAVSDKSGRYEITGVPEGKYLLHVWYQDAAPEALEGPARTVTVKSGQSRTLPTITIAAVKKTPAKHKNKYGQDYDPDSGKTDY